MRKLTVIQQGESLDFEFDRGENVSIQDWTCTIYVRTKAGGADGITPREIEPSGNSWPGYLTQTETAGLALSTNATGPWNLIALMQNTTTDEEEQEVVRFRVTKPWV